MSGVGSGRVSSRRLRVNSPELRLVNWPLRDDRLVTWSLVVLWLLVATGVAVLVESPALGLLAFAALALAGWRMWIPVTYEFDRRGLVQIVLGRRRRIDWARIARIDVRRRGVLLLATPDPSRLAALRGVYVRWNDQQQELLALLQFYRGGA